MKKRLVSLLMALALCLGLLPATALAAGGIDYLYIGGQLISESGCYENQKGNLGKGYGTETASGQIYSCAHTPTLTLYQDPI